MPLFMPPTPAPYHQQAPTDYGAGIARVLASVDAAAQQRAERKRADLLARAEQEKQMLMGQVAQEVGIDNAPGLRQAALAAQAEGKPEVATYLFERAAGADDRAAAAAEEERAMESLRLDQDAADLGWAKYYAGREDAAAPDMDRVVTFGPGGERVYGGYDPNTGETAVSGLAAPEPTPAVGLFTGAPGEAMDRAVVDRDRRQEFLDEGIYETLGEDQRAVLLSEAAAGGDYGQVREMNRRETELGEVDPQVARDYTRLMALSPHYPGAVDGMRALLPHLKGHMLDQAEIYIARGTRR